MVKNRFILILLFFCTLSTHSQTVYHHTNNTSVYSFLDEMANSGLIEVNSSVKPWSRLFIATKLASLDTLRHGLNNRQQKELDFFLKDFNKELKPDKNFNKRFDIFYYKDSLFTFSGNLIFGAEYFTNNNGDAYYWWNGGEVFAYVGKHLGVYASLRDQHDKEFLVTPEYMTRRAGMRPKTSGDFEEMRGGITLSWKWGTVGLIKDHHSWGNNYNGANIQSGRTPSFAKITLNLKPASWFEFNYYHGWLVSEVVDSNRSYTISNSYGWRYRRVYHPKYTPANMFTFTPVKKLNISVGNSIIYSDIGIQAAYLVPVFFYKAVDHTLNAGNDNMNSQMFLDISSRNIRNLHLYFTWFVDEVNIGNMFKSDLQSNYFSFKLGGRLSNLPLQNIALTAEYTRTHPNVFRHYIPTLTYRSNQYNLGHYLEDNSEEYFLSLAYRPIRGLLLDLSWMLARKGPDYTEMGTERIGLPYIETTEWENNTLSFKACYEIINDGYLFGEYRFSNITGDVDKYTHPLFHSNTNTLSIGINFGF